LLFAYNINYLQRLRHCRIVRIARFYPINLESHSSKATDALANSHNNLGEFYKHVNSRIQYRTPINALLNSNGTVITSESVKANMFNNFYATTGVVDDGKISSCRSMELTSVLDTVVFSETDIILAISKLKPNLSCGPDNLLPVLFKKIETLPGKATVITVQPAIVRCCCPFSMKAGYYYFSVQERHNR